MTNKYKPVPAEGYPGWFEIPGYSRYAANREGYILHKRLNHKTQGGISSRYRKTNVYPDDTNQPTLKYTHDLICRAFYGPPEPGQVVLHQDNDRLNLNANNLRWGTQSENMYQVYRDGLRTSTETYQEEDDSFFSHNHHQYRLNPVLALAQQQKPVPVSMRVLQWNVENTPINRQRYLDADITYPIVVMLTPEWGWVVLDGSHRLAKAYDLKQTTIPAYVLHPSDIEPFRLPNSGLEQFPYSLTW